jgi:cell division protein FtsW
MCIIGTIATTVSILREHGAGCRCTRYGSWSSISEQIWNWQADVELARKVFISVVAMLLGFGITMVYSASITSRPSQVEQVFLSRHLIFVAIGLMCSWLASQVPSRWWYLLAPYLFWGTLILLVLVLIPGVGARVNGARRWFRIGTLSCQPSELMKIALPLFLCRLAVRKQDDLRSWRKGIVPVAYPIALASAVVLVEPDLGTALFLAISGGIALWISGWPVRNYLMLGSAAIPAIAIAVLRKPYQMQRIYDFLATWSDWTQAPYHLKQSLVTLGGGGLWGLGLGEGFQKLSFLPEANTDFVFAVIGEELGLIGALFVIGLWMTLYITGLILLREVKLHQFAARAAFVLLTQLLFQVTINIAVVTAMVPPKGIAHPLISYGGSNLVITLTAVGVLLGLTRPESEGGEFPEGVELFGKPDRLAEVQ